MKVSGLDVLRVGEVLDRDAVGERQHRDRELIGGSWKIDAEEVGLLGRKRAITSRAARLCLANSSRSSGSRTARAQNSMNSRCQSAWLERQPHQATPGIERDRLGRALAVHRFRDECQSLADTLLHQRVEELVLAGKARVDGTLCQASGARDFIQ